jgi:hydrogenase expression/formation protein HypD
VKHLVEYRDHDAVKRLVERIRTTMTRPWRVMEICGGQTHSIMRAGLQQLLPSELQLIHGPGCPVCVTAEERIDQAIALAFEPNTILCTFGDMLRVPGSQRSLLQARAEGAKVAMVTSPLDALHLARKQPAERVVFFAVGFETTAPTTAATVREAHARRTRNFSVLTAHVRVPPALTALFSAPDHEIDGLLAAGHVCSVMGYEEYVPIAAQFGVPIVVTGFEPTDILQGLLACVAQLERLYESGGECDVLNRYARVVQPGGNPVARALIESVFEITDLPWRGLGTIAAGGLRLRPEFALHDASLQLPRATSPMGPSEVEPFRAGSATAVPNPRCISGLVLQGRRRPTDCPAFGTECTPERPLGAPMVSGEGACAAYYRHAPSSPRGEARG